MTKASAALSASTMRRSGSATASTSRWLSMPKGPSASVAQRIAGPPAKRNAASAWSIPAVTAVLELGLMTRISPLRSATPLPPRTSPEIAMPEPTYHLVIRGGTVATGRGAFAADVAISGESIAAIGHGLPAGAREIDATGKLVLPGGVDSHAHIEQVSAAGILNADSFESATASAALGGTTSVISFAAQHIGNSLDQVVADYHAAAERGAVVDY